MRTKPSQPGLERLQAAERQLIVKRRTAAGELEGKPAEDAVGVALSGGGIRSATFCLGLIQGMAKHGLIRKVDYLSTVSGGGYIGSFLGRMFTREWARDPEVLGELTGDSPGQMRDHLRPVRNEFKERIDSEKRVVERVTATLTDNVTPPIRWLRGAGNYLTPTLSKDAPLAMAVFVRNWLAVLIVILITVLAVFLLWDWIRFRFAFLAWHETTLLLERFWPQLGLLDPTKSVEAWLASITSEHLWWTPSIFLPCVDFGLLVVPLAWAYWLTQAGEKRQTVLVILANLAVITLGECGYRYTSEIAWRGLSIEALLASAVYGMSLLQLSKTGTKRTSDELTRNKLSRWLSKSLIALAVTLVFGVVDGWSQSIYALVAYSGSFKLAGAAIASATGVTALAPLAKHVAALGKHKDSRFKVPFQIVAFVASVGLAFVLLLGMGYITHGIAWRWGCPEPPRFASAEIANPALMAQQAGSNGLLTLMRSSAPATDWNGLFEADGRTLKPGKETEASRVFAEALAAQIETNDLARAFQPGRTYPTNSAYFNSQSSAIGPADTNAIPRLLNRDMVDEVFPGSVKKRVDVPAQLYARFFRDQTVGLTRDRLVQVREVKEEVRTRPYTTEIDAGMISLCAAVSLLLCILLGRTITFLNLSSFHTLYTARLIQAYLGASNPPRWTENTSIKDFIPDDDIAWQEYRPHEYGGPLHLVNVTINNTVSLDTGMESNTCRGLNLCLGPAGMSVGCKHAMGANDSMNPKPPGDQVFLIEAGKNVEGPAEDSASPKPDRVQLKNVEALTLGHWIGISGAAFTTGLGNVGGGAGTAVGTSLLCGLFNVRLGYWWKNDFANRTLRGDSAFPVQTYLLDEFTGSFDVQDRQRWYLSDGGHFENTAAYELIRRRVPFIVVADCGADAKGDFDDIGNLVRRVRMDFEAEISFLTDADLMNAVNPEKLAPCVVSRSKSEGQAENEPENGSSPNVGRIGALDDLRPLLCATSQVDEAACSRVKAHATVARVSYPGTKAPSTILFIKPGITEDLPADVVNYQRSQKSFPQQSTLDQFFDEAQWESYRKLGQCVGEALFAPPSKSQAWTPGEMRSMS